MALASMSLEASDLSGLIESLRKMGNYSGSVKVELSLPMAANDEVEYTVYALSREVNEDSLSSIDYLIEWALAAPDGTVKGFSSYFDGHFYRFRDGFRLQEYHVDENIQPFISVSPVQKTTQFIDLFPVKLGDEIAGMACDSTYSCVWTPDTLFRGLRSAVLKAKRTVNDETVAELVFVFDAVTLVPEYIEREMSPGSISEQTVVYKYQECDLSGLAVPRVEEQLIGLYPEAFADFREGAYRLTSLKGRTLPAFSLPELDGGRLTRQRNDRLENPTLVAFVEEEVGTTTGLISEVRGGLRSLPFNADIIWIFLSNRHDDIIQAVGKILPEETVLASGRNIVKDFGVTETPSFIIVGRDGIVTDVMIGYGTRTASAIMQKMAMAK